MEAYGNFLLLASGFSGKYAGRSWAEREDVLWRYGGLSRGESMN